MTARGLRFHVQTPHTTAAPPVVVLMLPGHRHTVLGALPTGTTDDVREGATA